MNRMRIIYQDEYLVAIDKPPGFQVHTPENMIHQGKTLYRNNVMKSLREQLGEWVYPVHRLDRATTGVLLFALSSDIAAKLQQQFKENKVHKTYLAMARGWLPDQGVIDLALDEKEAKTFYHSLFRFELQIPTAHHPTSRYSVIETNPVTGRFHQIRRHLKHLSHPLIGDTIYGDGKHNRIWRELAIAGLFLKSYRIQFQHPVSGEQMILRSKWGKLWLQLFEQCGWCPWI